MRLENQGLTLWYCTSDAPGPEGVVPADEEVRVTVGLSPVDASNQIEMHYRVNGGAINDISTDWFRNDQSGDAQYFTARLPAFATGDEVDWWITARCSGRYVPAPGDTETAVVSFRCRAPGTGVTEEPRASHVSVGSPCGAILDELRAAAESNPRLPCGELASPVKVPTDIFTCLFREALSPKGSGEGWFVWRDLGSEVAVHLERTRVALLPGFVICGLRMKCDQVLDTAELTVPLATGTVGEPAGLLMTGEIAARGDALLVDAWGDVAVAACWTAVVDVAIRVAAAAGIDACCGPLLPGAVWTAEDMFIVIPQARHAIDTPKAPGVDRR